MITKIFKMQTSQWWIGLGLLIVSALLLLLLSDNYQNTGNSQGLFIIHIMFTGVFSVVIFFERKSIPAAYKLANYIVFLGLMLISAWSLNNNITVFHQSVMWMTILQIATIVALIVLCFYQLLPQWINYFFLFITGVGCMLFVYMSLYLLPMYLISIVLLPALGFSLHSFIAVFITICIVLLVIKLSRYHKKYLWAFLWGVVAALVCTIIFLVQWFSAVRLVNTAYHNSLLNHNPDVPAWIQVSQQLPHTAITEKVLKTGVVYVNASDKWNNWGFDFSGFSRYHEAKKHDPLIAIASLFVQPEIGNNDKINILESTYKNRYATEERLWSGESLTTENVVTTINIWPQWQMAYTEKTIAVRNNNLPGGIWSQQEAIYLFHLPEGAVISSLSLWVNGVEEKGILTTKEKADTAYKTIVGVEKRDPSIVHWQEGNEVSVRVFPVLPADNRVFKIGITTPLLKNGNSVQYNNINFTGPPAHKTAEIIELKISGNVQPISVPGFFHKLSGRQYYFKGRYKHQWELLLKEPALSNKSFAYKNKVYNIARYTPQLVAADLQKIYMDVDNSWSRQEWQQVLDIFKNRPVYVWHGSPVKVEKNNADELFARLCVNSFSLFPVYNITEPAKVLLITKGNPTAPNLKDMANTPFAEKMKVFLQKSHYVNVVDIGNGITPYLKTLREYRALHYEKGNMELLSQIATTGKFPYNSETDDRVVLKDAGLMINRSDSSEAALTGAPDHLYRLFAYNNIMRQMGKNRADSTADDNELITTARQANIVTPLSSLIVLETKADYERFDIKAIEDGLNNAAHNKSGAVPEPHEWALIITGLAALLYMHYTKKRNKKYA